MKYYYLVRLVKPLLGLLILLLIQSCNNETRLPFEQEKLNADSESESEVRKEIEGLYEVYTKSDLKWVDYYSQEYKLASDDGTVQLKNRDSLRTEWEDIYNRYEVVLRERGAPVLNVSGNQVFHYNSFDELFIKKATQDTFENIGTWVVLWKRQADSSWKIEFETYHAE